MSEPAAVVDSLLQMTSRLRRDRGALSRLEAGIAQSSGLHPTSLRRLVELWLGGASPRSLGRMVALAEGRRPAGRVGIVAPGNLCVATWQAMIEALVTGNTVRIRAGSGDRLAPGNLVRLLAETDEELAAQVELVQFERGDETGWRTFFDGLDALLIYGGDPAVESVARRAAEAGYAGPIRRHGHGVSLGLLPARLVEQPEQLMRLARGLAHDALLADGRGCLSLRALLVEGGLEGERGTRLGKLLAAAFADSAERLPPRQIAMDLLARPPRQVEEVGFLAATGDDGGWVHHEARAGWAIVARPSAGMHAPLSLVDLGPGARCLVLLPLVDRQQLPAAMAPLRTWLSGLARPLAAATSIDPLAHQAGFDRTCPFGRLHAPDADVPTDGVSAGTGLLLPAAAGT